MPYKKGTIINIPFFGAMLKPNEMFLDDLWWKIPSDIEIRANVIQVIPNTDNPMVLKAEKIFQEALRK